jgi:hypothetical protein
MEEDILARGEDPSLFPVLNSKPEMFRDLQWIWEGFMCLSTSRQYGMGSPQPISVSDITAYCLFRDIHDADDRDDFMYHVQRLDAVFMKDWGTKQKNKDNTQGQPPARLGG